MQFPVTIGLHRFYLYDGLLCLVHAASAYALYLGFPANGLLVGGLAVIIFSLAWSLRRAALTTLHLHADGSLTCGDRSGTMFAVDVLPDTVVLSWLVVLRVRRVAEKEVIALPLLAGHLSAREFRRLRVWLRWKARLDGGAAPIS